MEDSGPYVMVYPSQINPACVEYILDKISVLIHIFKGIEQLLLHRHAKNTTTIFLDKQLYYVNTLKIILHISWAFE